MDPREAAAELSAGPCCQKGALGRVVRVDASSPDLVQGAIAAGEPVVLCGLDLGPCVQVMNVPC